jgi:cytochrome bd-type quinol oxidase subunit 2
MLHTGIIMNVLGCLFMLLVTAWRVHNQLQSKIRMLFVVVLIGISMISAMLTLARPDDKIFKFVFGSISMVFPASFVFFLGGILIVITSFQGTHAVSISHFLFVLAALLAFIGSILILTSPQKKNDSLLA